MRFHTVSAGVAPRSETVGLCDRSFTDVPRRWCSPPFPGPIVAALERLPFACAAGLTLRDCGAAGCGRLVGAEGPGGYVRYPWRPRRSGRVAEGGALLRRYGGECLHRGFESLLLRWTGPSRACLSVRPATLCGPRR